VCTERNVEQDRERKYKVILWRDCATIAALVTQHAKRMRRIILLSVAASAVAYHIMPHYLIDETIFEKQVIEHKKCVFWFSSRLYLTHFSFHRIMQRDTIM
jgi:hypothetical protein